MSDTTALFVVSEEGYWAEECIEPLTTLDDAGVDVTVATPSGSPPVVDERSLDPADVGEETVAAYREIHETDDRLRDPEPIARTDAAEYDAVVFHGTVWDVNHDRHARTALREAVAGDDGTPLVVCHAVGILGFARTPNGEFLVDGRDVTGFPNEWEEGIVDELDRVEGRKLPYWVEDEVVAAGGNFDAELDADTSVAVDGDLITARGPGSSSEAAETLLAELDVEASA